MDIYGVIGWPIKHSLSPAMHNAAFKKLGIDAEYRLFEVRPEELEDFLLHRRNVVGFNITIPHKVRAKEILEKNFPPEKKKSKFEERHYIEISGAVNTVKRIDDIVTYCNTDVRGFLDSLQRDLKFDLYDLKGNKKDKFVLLIGCGGAGRAVIAGLSWDLVDTSIKKIYIYDKNKESINSIKKHFSKLDRTWGDNLPNITEFIDKSEIPKVIKKCQLLVNASPVGMEEGNNTAIIDRKSLRKGLYVYDLVYNRETQLIKDAKLCGCNVVGGKGMLKYQGARSFEFWTGVSRGRVLKVMGEALERD